MFDVDGTLVESYEFDGQCFVEAVFETTGWTIDDNWGNYPHVTDKGILQTLIQRHASHYRLEVLETLVKPVFISKIKAKLHHSPARPLAGAVEFFNDLKHQDCTISIATGGWGESAKLKLASAGFDTENITLVSSDDHYARIEIMKLAAGIAPGIPITYFGDGEWDKHACEALNINLIIVGERVEHNQQVQDFTNMAQLLNYMGLK